MTVPRKDFKIELLKVKDLDFDPQNPRFSRYFDLEQQPEAEVVERMVKAENVQELMGSIGEQGYFGGEPLLVAHSGHKKIVVEGNRRLAALKLLLGYIAPKSALPSIDAIRAEAKPAPTEVECIVFDDRKDILRYLGYRHITGAKKWDSLSKARYLKQLRDEFYSGLSDDEQHRAIAKEIGSRKDYVAQMLAGLNVFERAQAADFYGMQRVRAEDVDFGVLTTALSYSNISEYVGLSSRIDTVGENLEDEHIKDLLSWVFAQDQQGDTILGESRNLRKLSAVIANDVAREKLKKDGNLEVAYLHSEGPSKALTKALDEAYGKLLAAYDMVPSVDSFDRSHEQAAEKLVELSEDVMSLISRAVRRQKRGSGRDE